MFLKWPRFSAGITTAIIQITATTPAHAAGEIQRLMKAVREDRMPRDETDIEQPLDDKLKSALLESGGAFEALVQAAKDWEAGRQVRSTWARRAGE